VGAGKGIPEGDSSDEDGGEPEFQEEVQSEEQKEEAARLLEEELSAVEIKSGDYQVVVHIIEVRDLKSMDDNGLSDPIVLVECMGQRANTHTEHQKLSVAFDSTFIFNYQDLHKNEVDVGVLKIDVMDENKVCRNSTIGGYHFDISHIYAQKHHEMHRQWVALADVSNPVDTTITGFVRLSISVTGPGDKAHVHDAVEDMKRERESGNDGMQDALVPASVLQKTGFLVVDIHKAEDLVQMDSRPGAAGGLDAYAAVKFGSQKEMRTRVKKLKGERKDLRPKFRTQLGLPCTVPSAASTIDIGIYDWDMAGSNDLVGRRALNFKEVARGDFKKKPRWLNLYGPPLKKASSGLGDVVGLGTSLASEARALMQNFPDLGTTYRGRILVSAWVELDDEQKKKGLLDSLKDRTLGGPTTKQNAPSRKPGTNFKKRVPPTVDYKLAALVVSATELPPLAPTSLVSRSNAAKIGVLVTCGLQEIVVERKPNSNGLASFGREIQEIVLKLPAYEVFSTDAQGKRVAEYIAADQVPDVIVYLFTGEVSSPNKFAFVRYRAADLIKQKFMGGTKWHMMGEDPALDALKDDMLPGNLQMRLGFGLKQDFDQPAVRASWQADVEALAASQLQPFEVRVHVFQGRGLPATDSSGSMDPYVKVKFGGVAEDKALHQTAVVNDSLDPVFYKTMVFSAMLPKRLDLAQQVNVQVYDRDDGILDSDDFAGNTFLNLSDPAHTIQPGHQGPRPKPIWRDMFLQTPGDCEGELLVQAEVIKKTSAGQVLEVPQSIVPAMRDAYIEIVALGMRALKPYKMISIQNPFVEVRG
jgi:hypothetical protein